MQLVLYSIYIIWVLSVVVHTKEALIFDRFDGYLYLLPKEISENLQCGAWAVACPAETPAEKDFAKQYSFTKNAMFVKEICNRGNKASGLKTRSCKESYNISLSYKLRNQTLQFGYEIYYDLGDEKYFHRDITLGDYKKPEEVIKSLKSIPKKTKLLFKEAYRIGKKSLGLDIKELWLDGDKRMGFMWLYLFKVNFDFLGKSLKMVWYEIENNNKWAVGVKCDNYSLGAEVYGETNVDGLYVQQSRIFTNIKLPTNLNESNDEELLVKWLLVPIDQFHFGSETQPICSNLLTIPIWKNKVESIMKKVDAFLYSLFRVLNEPIQIVSGISGVVLASPKKGYLKKALYLDPENSKVRIPEIVYKIVEYQLKDCDEKEMLCWYSAIIVVHNVLFFNKKDKLCSKDVTMSWGYEELTKDYDNNEYSDMIYVCENNASMQKKLSIASHEVAGRLNLMNFPYINKDTMKLDEVGRMIKDDVNKTYQTLRMRGEFPISSNEIIERSHTPSNVIQQPEVGEGSDDSRSEIQ